MVRGRRSLLAAAVAAAGVAAYAVVTMGGVEGGWTAPVVNLTQVAVPLAAGAACLRAARLAAERGYRRGWWLLGASCWSWGLGQAAWSWFELVLLDDPFPSAADVGYLGAVPLGLAAMWCFSSAESRPQPRLRSAVDGLLIAGALLFVSWAFVLGPSWRSGGEDPLVLALSLTYPIGNVVTGAVVLSVLARRGGTGRSPLALIGAGLFVLALADSQFAWEVAAGHEYTSGLADVAWVVGYLAIGVAALRGSRLPEDDDEAVDDRPSMRRLALPYLAIVAAGVARLVLAVLGRPVDGVLTGTAVALIVLVLLRQLLTLRENVELSQHLSGRLDDLKAREDELRFQAFHDPLTGLANRQLFRDRVQHALDRRRRTLQPGAVLFLDLDDFKTVNDRLGHAAGDELLGDVARRLEACVRAGDTVARLGGDEFGVLLEELADVEDATAVADRMTDALTTPFTVAGRELTVRASVGIAYTAMLDETAEQLLGNADVALYAAKAAGKGGIRVFEHSMRSAVVERLELVADLQSAFERGELVVYYQPVVRLDDGCTTAVEALVRWRHPTRGLLSPGSFVALAEETGLIAPLGRTVLDQACRQVAEWQQSLGLPSLAVHVNLSARQLQRSEVVEEVHAALESSGLLPEHLVLEVTESILVRHGETGLDRLHTLKGLGVQLAIDDFGTGYSSLNYLRLLPVDVIKIDKAFAAPLGRRQEDMLLLQAIVDLGRSLGVAMIAEGIERADQAEALREIGCELAQGYWFAVPAEPREIEARLAIHHPAELTGSP